MIAMTIEYTISSNIGSTLIFHAENEDIDAQPKETENTTKNIKYCDGSVE